MMTDRRWLPAVVAVPVAAVCMAASVAWASAHDPREATASSAVLGDSAALDGQQSAPAAVDSAAKRDRKPRTNATAVVDGLSARELRTRIARAQREAARLRSEARALERAVGNGAVAGGTWTEPAGVQPQPQPQAQPQPQPQAQPQPQPQPQPEPQPPVNGQTGASGG